MIEIHIKEIEPPVIKEINEQTKMKALMLGKIHTYVVYKKIKLK